MHAGSTIVALATPPGEGGLAVVRVSGPAALRVANAVFADGLLGPSPEDRRAVYGILKWPTSSLAKDMEPGSPIDQVLALPLLGGRSYTGEDTVEFFCHGGRAVSRQVVAACRAAGAEPAQPGEFTRRAFLNGRLSLDQAEAVADLIHAEGSGAARAAIGQLLGRLDDQLAVLETPLLELLAKLEGSLEFVTEEEVTVTPEEVRDTLAEAAERIEKLLALAPAGRLLRDGIQVALTGPVNVGKSSLFNVLLAENRAIVDGEAGTTRDVVSGRLVRAGIVLDFQDTAGLRETPGRVEQMGIDRTRRTVAEADLVLALTAADNPEPVPVETEDTPVIRVLTKADLLDDAACATRRQSGMIITSCLAGEGIEDLWAAIDAVVADFGLAEAAARGIVLNERHRHKLELCHRDLSCLLAEFQDGDPGADVAGTLLFSILAQLGEISGRVFTEQLLENIFKRFCVGK